MILESRKDWEIKEDKGEEKANSPLKIDKEEKETSNQLSSISEFFNNPDYESNKTKDN